MRTLAALALLTLVAGCGGESAAHKQAHENAEIVADATCAVEKGLDEHSAVRDYLRRWEAANTGK